MSTTTFLSNATITFTQGLSNYTLSDQANQCTLTIGNDPLEITVFGNDGRRFAPGLESVELSITFFLNYGAGEVEAALADMVGKGNTTVVLSPSGVTESATNPEYTITNTMLASFTPINSTVGEIATVTATFTGGEWARDIVSP